MEEVELSERRIHVHVENYRPGESGLWLEPETLEAALAARSLPRDRIDLSFNDDPSRTEDVASSAEVLFAVRRPKTLAFAGGLKWVQSVSAGVEALLPLLPAGAVLTNASGVHADKGGEFILTAVLMLNYAIPQFVDDKAARRWEPRFESPLKGKRATLLGVGAIGAEGARLLKLLGAFTVGVTRSGTPRPSIDKSAAVSELDRILPQTDFLVSSLPLTAETAGLMDRRRLDLLPHHAGIVNVGRAKVFDTDALLSKLHQGTLGGAVLDVFPVEPVPADSPVWNTPRLIMTPHCSVDDHAVYMDRCVAIFADNLERYLNGAALRNVVDAGRGY